ncbi:hypothetical protein K504DRAFT_455117 [Pleomassaria siparia CBS 279.74]|uniref:Uncharacterized protein n=1 Tax=Pleomassaria siparia CBS 279.74 TaxID=1314801 RepID=A0A6G1K991_9PLEO|nr:hypothetical protein K504DRAFT_455117 [Pleomassaria siparia CBS 279.74]
MHPPNQHMISIASTFTEATLGLQDSQIKIPHVQNKLLRPNARLDTSPPPTKDCNPNRVHIRMHCQYDQIEQDRSGYDGYDYREQPHEIGLAMEQRIGWMNMRQWDKTSMVKSSIESGPGTYPKHTEAVDWAQDVVFKHYFRCFVLGTSSCSDAWISEPSDSELPTVAGSSALHCVDG